MACRGSGVRVPVAPPADEPPTITPRRRRGVNRIRSRHRETRTTVTETADSRTRVERYDPTRHRAALAGALGGARPVRDGPARHAPAQVLPVDDVPVSRRATCTSVTGTSSRPSDALARFRRMHGFNVFFPIGFDAFGLPAENAAIKSGGHPFTWTMANIENMRRQFRTMGATFSWKHEVVTADPSLLPLEPVAVPALPGEGPGVPGQVAGRLVPQRRHPGARAGRGPGAALLALRRAGREARPRPVVPEDDRLRRRAAVVRAASTGPSRSASSRRTGSAARKAPRSTSRPRRPTTIRAARRCACSRRGPTRCSAPRSWSSLPEHPLVAGADRARAARGGRRVRRAGPAGGPRSTACRPTARRPASPSAPTRSTRSTASGSRSSSPTTCCPATGPARSWRCPPTTSATSRSPDAVRPAHPARRRRARHRGRRPDGRRLRRAHRRRAAGQQRPLRRHAGRRGRQGHRREAGRRRARPSRRSPIDYATG